MDIKGKEILVVGTGLSGAGSVHLLLQEKAKVTVLEQNDKLSEEEVRQKLREEDRDAVRVIVGEYPAGEEEKLAFAVFSPAVPMDAPLALRLKGAGISIYSEIELGYRAARGEIIAITGTNGKTTTTTLVGEIMKAATGQVYVVGNIGFSYAGIAKETTEKTVCVAEISSFQLEGVETFHPHVSAILNITPDHLNRHHTMGNYIAAKERITENQTWEDFTVLNFGDPVLREFGQKHCPGKVIWFSGKEKLTEGYYLDGEEICCAADGKSQALMNVHDMRLVGVCNYENVMAAIAMTSAMGVPMETILSVIRTFSPVEHRIEFVATKAGVDYYNDSKGTNPDAAIQGIRAMSKPTILIGGGYDKGSEYDAWIEAFDGKVKELVLIGQTKEKIAACAKSHGFEKISFHETFKEAMEHCTEIAQPGDTVLLSPACASWGMFPNYEERGRIFKEYVNHLA